MLYLTFFHVNSLLSVGDNVLFYNVVFGIFEIFSAYLYFTIGSYPGYVK